MSPAVSIAIFVVACVAVLGGQSLLAWGWSQWKSLVASRQVTPGPEPVDESAVAAATESSNLESNLLAGKFTAGNNFDAVQRLFVVAETAKRTGHPLGADAVEACRTLLAPLAVEWPTIAVEASKQAKAEQSLPSPKKSAKPKPSLATESEAAE